MLKEFKVENFKGFEKEFSFDLNSKTYVFNKESIKNNIVNTALIYGHNGVGKSNLGIALFDIITHITDKFSDPVLYENYLNAKSKLTNAKFEYVFSFDNVTVTYNYKKCNYGNLIYESFSVDDDEVILFDKNNKKLEITLEGAENLNIDIKDVTISIVKYIKSNTILKKNRKSDALKRFFDFVDNMLLFWSLETRNFQGYAAKGTSSILTSIIDNNNFKDLKNFLKDVGVDDNIKISSDASGNKKIVFDFDGKEIDFWKACSTGVRSLTLFYYWLQSIRFSKTPPSLIFIDEFDAFYHSDISKKLVEELKKCTSQVILTTHNTSNISNKLLRPDCYYLMYKDKIKSLANRTSKELREAHNIEKMYRAGAFNE